ncbi:MAG: T9SS type A sorting domain-containing protein [Bacteroidota bacterium]
MKIFYGSLTLICTALLVFTAGTAHSQSAMSAGTGAFQQPDVLITQSTMARARVPLNVRSSLMNNKLPAPARQALERYARKLIQVENQRSLSSASMAFVPDTLIYDSMGTDNNWHEASAQVYSYNNLGLATLTVSTRRSFSQNIRKDIQGFTAEGLFNYQKSYLWNDTISAWKEIALDSVFYDSHGNMVRNSEYSPGPSGWVSTYKFDSDNTYTPEGWLKRTGLVYTDFVNTDFGYISNMEVLEFGQTGEPLLRKYTNSQVNGGNADSTENRVYGFHNFSPGAAEQADSVVILNYSPGPSWYAVNSWSAIFGEFGSYRNKNYTIINNTATLNTIEDVQLNANSMAVKNQYDSVLSDGRVKLLWKQRGNFVVQPNGFISQVTFVKVTGANPTDSIYVARYRYFGAHPVTGNTIKQNAPAGAFPNPFQNSFQISLPAGINSDAYTLTDLGGRVLRQGEIAPVSGSALISASGLNAGMYLLNLSNKGRLVQCIKVSKAE